MITSKRSIWSVIPVLCGIFFASAIVSDIISYAKTGTLIYNGTASWLAVTALLCILFFRHIRNMFLSLKLSDTEIEIKKIFSSPRKYNRADIKNLTDNVSGKKTDGFYTMTFYIENNKYTVSELYFRNYKALRQEILKDYEAPEGIHSPLSLHRV